MANDKKFIAKNGLRTQNAEYYSPDRTNVINVEMLDSDTLSWEGDSGQLFSITDSLTGVIFSVNDISGVPSIEVDDDGTIRLAEFAGNVLIGTATDDDTNKLQVDGSVSATSFSGDLDYTDITNPPTITAGNGLTGGGTGNVTLNHEDTSSQASVDNSDGTVIQDVTLDTYGHITSLGSVDLDSRYLQSYTETDTLDSVTDRGATTTNAIEVGEVTSDLFFRNKDTVSSNQTVPNDGRNSMSVGPITIDSGVTITVESGARWVVI